jgi:hypothetical protein
VLHTSLNELNLWMRLSCLNRLVAIQKFDPQI